MSESGYQFILGQARQTLYSHFTVKEAEVQRDSQ